jgi:hypothetical protein
VEAHKYWGIKTRISTIWKQILGILKLFIPSKEAVLGAAWGILIVATLLLVIPSSLLIKHIGFINVLIMTVFLMAGGILIGLLSKLIFRLLSRIPSFLWLAMIVCFLLIFLQLTFTPKGSIIIFLYLVTFSAFAGGAIMVIVKGPVNKLKLSGKISLTIFGLLGFVGLVLFTWWLIHPGKTLEMPEIAALKGEFRPHQIQAEDPGIRGEHNILYLTYGSGVDKQRKEYASEVAIQTDSVDGSFLVDGWDGFQGKLRTRYFGFDLKSLPRNARVWYPEDNGPFPLVLIVHGNHLAQDFSDPGYEYLGKLLASRGFIMASVDENFFNGSFTNVFKGLQTENDARGWMLLEHLKLWREWNSDSTSVFYQKVDMDNISLIGHSRGGEAVGHAALFNKLPYYPDNFRVQFDYGFSLKSIVAIAPCDGQYQPSGIKTPLKDVNYFIIHGSHDADVQSFVGMKQYERVLFTEGFKGVKASLYIFNANHGQFNTRWGRKDNSSPRINLMNLRQLMPGEEQEKIAQTFITAFLEITLKDREEYLPLFMDYRTGKNWLPETIYLSRFDHSDMKYICQFDEDLDLTTTTTAGGTIDAENLTVWREQLVKIKWGDKETRAAYIGWNNNENDSLTAQYTVTIPEGVVNTAKHKTLFFSLADANENSNPFPKEKEQENDSIPDESMLNNGNAEVKIASEEEKSTEKEKKNGEREAIDFSIEVTDVKGETVRFKLSDFSFLQPQLEAKMAKFGFLTSTPSSESLYQFYKFQLDRFVGLNEQFQLDKISRISLIFDQTEEGVIILDNLGFM